MKRRVTDFLQDESGGQMAEYALLLMIALIVAGAALWLSGIIQTAYLSVVEGIDTPGG